MGPDLIIQRLYLGFFLQQLRFVYLLDQLCIFIQHFVNSGDKTIKGGPEITHLIVSVCGKGDRQIPLLELFH
ncbi:hypothetical protein D3C72_2418950 [compost metagenome]